MHKSVLLALLIGNVVLRFFTNHLTVLPRVFNIADVFLIALLVLLFFLGARDRRPLKFGWAGVGVTLVVFDLLAILGTLLNSNYIYWLS